MSRVTKEGISRRSFKKITRRQAIGTMAKVAGAGVAGLAMGGVVGHPAKARAAATEERQALAQKYKNAEPGEKFMIGYLTWGLAQGYLMMCWQANEQACDQLGLTFSGAVCEDDPAWISKTESMIAAGAKAIVYNCPSAAMLPELTRICN